MNSDPSIFSLSGKSALVAGASRGIGLAIARHMAEAGVRRISVGSAFSNAALGALVSAARELRDEGTYGFLDLAATGRAQASDAFRAQ